MAANMESMLKSLTVKNFGRTMCYDIIIKNKFIHHTQIFTMTLDMFPSSFSDQYRQKLHMELMSKKPKTFGEVLRACEFSGLDSRALTLGKGFTSAEQFYTEYNYNLSFIKDRLKIKKDATPLKIHRTLIENESLIKKISTFFVLEKEAEYTLNVVVTGSITEATREDGTDYANRETFIKELKDQYKKYIDIKPMSSVTKNTMYLISDKASTSNKSKAAKKLGVPIISSKEFIDTLEHLKEKLEE